MQIRRIQNDNPSFTATLKIKGGKIDKFAEQELKDIAEKIGTSKDKIDIMLGKVEYNSDTLKMKELSEVYTDGKRASRVIKAKSDINGTVEEANLSFSRTSESFSPEHTTINNIKKYLMELVPKFEINKK